MQICLERQPHKIAVRLCAVLKLTGSLGGAPVPHRAMPMVVGLVCALSNSIVLMSADMHLEIPAKCGNVVEGPV